MSEDTIRQRINLILLGIRNQSFMHIYFTQKEVFFSAAKRMDWFYFYEDDGMFYEFFSGICIGCESEGILQIPETRLRINLIADEEGFCEARFMTASDFAAEVKPYIIDKELIASAVSLFMERSHHQWLKQREEQAMATKIKKQRDADNSNWLNDVLDQRK